MTIGELEAKLRAGAQLDQLFEFTTGQCCQIYKAKDVKQFDGNHDIIYIPDTSLNEIPTDRALDSREINAILEFFFTGYSFMETCLWDERIQDIFEGDILKICHRTTQPVGLTVVRYDKKWAAFRAFSVERPWYSVQITGLDEVVGNVYDNPDLAKGGRKHDESRA